MHVRSAEFVTSATKPSQYPPALLPEIAFAGCSNTGKSTLINRLVNRKRLVKTSSTPGRTQLINFFEVNGDLGLVDLPGYGYARVPEAVRRQWGPMVERFLTGRPTLQGVVLVMDIRRTPGQREIGLVDWLDRQHIPVVPVLTKADKLKRSARARQHSDAARRMGMAAPALIVFSATTRQGLPELWRAIESLLPEPYGSVGPERGGGEPARGQHP